MTAPATGSALGHRGSVPSFPRKRESILSVLPSSLRKRESTHVGAVREPIRSHKTRWALFYPFVLSLSKYERAEQNAATNPPFTLRQAQGERLGAHTGLVSDAQGQEGQRHVRDVNATPLVRESPLPGRNRLGRKRDPVPAGVPSFPRKRESIPVAASAENITADSRSARFIRRAAPLVLGILLYLLLPSALAAADGVVTGTVVNGTAGGSVPADVAVTLYFLRDGQIVEQRTQVTDAQGAYRFTGLATDPGLRFVVVAAYIDVPYNTPELQFAGSAAIQAPPLTVYEASQDPSVVRVVTDVLILSPGEEGSGMLAIIEVVRLANDSDRTYLATGGAGSGAPMDRVLRFALPADAQDLTVLSGLSAQNVVEINSERDNLRGFGVFMPLLPGEREVAFGYQLPYSGSALPISKRTVYPTDHFAIIALEEHGLRFNSAHLEVQATPIGDRRYLVGSANGLAARAEVRVEVAGLPAPSLRVRLERLFDWLRGAQASVFVLLGVVLVLPILYAVYRLRGGRRRTPARKPAAAAASSPKSAAPDANDKPFAMRRSNNDRESLLLEIAQLDDDFAAGALAEADYHRQRAEKKQRLLDIYRQEGAEVADE